MGINVTIHGNIGTDLEKSATSGGTTTAQFRVASTDRRYNSQTSQWEDKKDRDGNPSTSWVTAIAYGKNAEKVLQTFKKGDAVKITGQLEVRDFERGDHSRGTAVEVSVAGIENPFENADEAPAE